MNNKFVPESLLLHHLAARKETMRGKRDSMEAEQRSASAETDETPYAALTVRADEREDTTTSMIKRR